MCTSTTVNAIKWVVYGVWVSCFHGCKWGGGGGGGEGGTAACRLVEPAINWDNINSFGLYYSAGCIKGTT